MTVTRETVPRKGAPSASLPQWPLMVVPPSAIRAEPVTKPASLEASWAIPAATSSARPIRGMT